MSTVILKPSQGERSNIPIDASKTPAPAWQSDPSQRLKDKVALVTGIGSGIGQGCALLFARQGAKVFGSDINELTAGATAAQAEAAGFPFAGVAKVDLAREADIKQWVADAKASAGGIDILVNAGAYGVFGWIEDITLADFRTTLEGEVDIVFMACQAVWPEMKRRGGGSIINFASANAHHALKGSPALAHVAAKGAVLAMTHQLAMEGAPHGIRANSISPGLIVSAATRPVLADHERAEQLRLTHMIPRFGQPADIAWAALYLASDESSWVTASEIRVDGGTTHW
jgi:NAD(P)-dependent dehydrogenase (short-subunit alcohol dehydrogenase family)